MELSQSFQFFTNKFSSSVTLQEDWSSKDFNPLSEDCFSDSISSLVADKLSNFEFCECINDIQDVSAGTGISFILFEVDTNQMIKIDSSWKSNFWSRDSVAFYFAYFTILEVVNVFPCLLIISVSSLDHFPQMLLVDMSKKLMKLVDLLLPERLLGTVAGNKDLLKS